MAQDCCNDESQDLKIGIAQKLIGKYLYLTINGVTVKTDLSNLVDINLLFGEIVLPIENDGQTFFLNVIPEGKQLAGVFVEGIRQRSDIDYTVVNRNITWNNFEYSLITSLSLIITVI